MSALRYQRGRLHVESVSAEKLAAEFGTPLYAYSHKTIRDGYLRCVRAFGASRRAAGNRPLVAYSAKANTNGAILRLLAGLGAGLDIVSGGELHRGLKAGFAPEKIVYSGVGKTEREIRQALRAGIAMFNVESVPEADLLNQVALAMGKRARVALRINPDIDAGTHAYITTGRIEDKFGINYDAAVAAYEHVAALPGLEMHGLDMHIGSEILRPAPYHRALRKMVRLAKQMRRKGATIDTLNIGGGYGIGYRGHEAPLDLEALAAEVLPVLEELGVRLIMEPGRSVVARAGSLLTRVTYVKRTTSKNFLIVDGAMNDLIRPMLYDDPTDPSHSAWHDILPGREAPPRARRETYDVVGGICESGDFFAKGRDLPTAEAGDLLAVADAGAYGFVMASTYNSRPRPAEVLVKGREAFLIRRRETYRDLTATEKIPEFLL